MLQHGPKRGCPLLVGFVAQMQSLYGILSSELSIFGGQLI
jgi:hypothetical protein